MIATEHAMTGLREPGAWYGAELENSDWRMPMTDAVIEELRVATRSRGGPRGPEGASELPAAAAFVRRVRERMFLGCGVVVCGRLPMSEWGEARALRAVATLSTLMGSPVMQTFSGTTFYAVEDRGVTPGPGVRRSLSNVPQPFHSDGPWLRLPPWIVGLFCIRAARDGGVSRCLSLKGLFADLEKHAPELESRLRETMFWHRQREHAPDESPVSSLPMVWRDEAGRWCCRYYADYVVNGYHAAGTPMDATLQRALEELARLGEEPGRKLEFSLRAGEVVWFNNRWCAHARTGFEPSSVTDHPRLMVRVWHRDAGDPITLDG